MRNAGDRAADGPSGRRQPPASPEPPPYAGTGAGASLFTPAYRVSHGPPDNLAGDRYGASADYAQAGSGPSGLVRPDYAEPGPGPDFLSHYDADRDSPWPGDNLSAGFGWGEDDPSADAWPGGLGQARPVASNAVRGFPPAPGEPLPVYPPGPFEAWNRGPDLAVAPRSGEAARDRTDGDANQLTSATITPDEFDTEHSLPAIKDPVLGTAASGAATIPARADAGARSRPGAGQTAPDPVRGESARHGTTAAPGTTARPAATRTAARRAGKRGGAKPGTTAGTRAGARAGAAQRKAHSRRHSHWPAIGVAAVIIVAVAAVLVYTLPRDSAASPPPKPRASTTASPTATGPTRPPGQWGFIGARTTDPTPLTTAEVFPAVISTGTARYTRATEVIGKNCRGSVIGTGLQAALHNGGCDQALRATYLSKSAKVMATIGVFNLKNAAEAGKAAAKAGHSQFVSRLRAKAGPARDIGQGTGLEEALFKGHYVVLVWAESTNVTASPTGKIKTKLDAFMNVLVAHTVNASLSYRMVDGKPPPGR